MTVLILRETFTDDQAKEGPLSQAPEPMCHHLGGLGAGIEGEAEKSEL